MIAYARTARALLPGWTTASQALPRVDRELRAIAGRNGSNLDAALGEAAIWLASVHGTRRIVVFTDERLAQRLVDAPPAELARGLPDGTLVHVVALTDTTGPLVRADDAMLAPLAAATEGIAVRGAGLDEDGAIDATLLVRPTSLDSIEVDAAGWKVADAVANTCEDAASIPEGTSCTWWGQGDASSGAITIQGHVWGRSFKRILRPDPANALALARALSAIGAFDAELQLEIDRVARAVNAVWSLGGSWGGTGGYADVDDMGLGRSSESGFSGRSDGGRIGTIRSAGIDRALVRAQLARGIAACHPGAAVGLYLETTLQEIVDVRVKAPPASYDCIVEAVWNTILAVPNAPDHAGIELAFTP